MKIAILAGDGIGPEITEEAVKVLKAVGDFEFEQALIGGVAFDKYGEHFPEETRKICENADAVLFGSVGGPVASKEAKWQGCETNSILALRKAFSFYANLRPVKLYKGLPCVLKDEIVEKGVDILCVRELLSCIYFGEHKTENGRASDVMQYTEDEVRAIARIAFEAAMKRSKKVTSVDKANVLDCSKLWRKVVEEVAKDYSECEFEHVLVDNMAMQIIKRPYDFDVLLMANMFGDIISDEASVLSSSLGMLPSASLNKDGFGLYEPSGGSAPDIAGRGAANPIGQILSAAMMLKYSFNMHKEHDAIVAAVDMAIADGYRTADIAEKEHTFVSTDVMGDAIVKYINL